MSSYYCAIESVDDLKEFDDRGMSFEDDEGLLETNMNTIVNTFGRTSLSERSFLYGPAFMVLEETYKDKLWKLKLTSRPERSGTQMESPEALIGIIDDMKYSYQPGDPDQRDLFEKLVISLSSAGVQGCLVSGKSPEAEVIARDSIGFARKIIWEMNKANERK